MNTNNGKPVNHSLVHNVSWLGFLYALWAILGYNKDSLWISCWISCKCAISVPLWNCADENLESNINNLPPAPSIVVSTSDGAYQIVVCAESKVIVESADMETAVFNIAYPKTLNALNTLMHLIHFWFSFNIIFLRLVMTSLSQILWHGLDRV